MNILVLLAFVPAAVITILLIRAFALQALFKAGILLFALGVGIFDIGGPQGIGSSGITDAVSAIGVILWTVFLALLKLTACLLPLILAAYLYTQEKYLSALGILCMLVVAGILLYPQLNSLSEDQNDRPVGSDAATLVRFPYTYFSKDSENVFWQNTVIPGADAATFEVLGSSNYAKDKNSVYYSDSKLTADPMTFVVLEPYGYAKDASSVWWSGMLVPEADPSTFTVTEDGFGKDAKHTYDTVNILN